MKMTSAERFDYNTNFGEQENSVKLFENETCDNLGMPRIRKQPSTPKSEDTIYKCDTCSFHTTRIDNIIRHHKSHSDPYRFHPAKETEHRFVFEKLGMKSHKKTKKMLSKNSGTIPKSISRKRLFSKSFSHGGSLNVIRTPKKREIRSDSLYKDHSSPRKKRAKLKQSPTKIPFTNPFEEEEEEEERKLQEMKMLEEEKKKVERLQETLANALQELSSDCEEKESASDRKKMPELAIVAWEEFIKDSNLKSRNNERTSNAFNVITKESVYNESSDKESCVEMAQVQNKSDELDEQKFSEVMDTSTCENKISNIITSLKETVFVELEKVDEIGGIGRENSVKLKNNHSELDNGAQCSLDLSVALQEKMVQSDWHDLSKNKSEHLTASNEINFPVSRSTDEFKEDSADKAQLLITEDDRESSTSNVSNKLLLDESVEPLVKNDYQPEYTRPGNELASDREESVPVIGNKSSLLTEESSPIIVPNVIYNKSTDLELSVESHENNDNLSCQEDADKLAVDSVNLMQSVVSENSENQALCESDELSAGKKDDVCPLKSDELLLMESEHVPTSKTVAHLKDNEQNEKSPIDLHRVDIEETVTPEECVLEELSNELVEHSEQVNNVHHIAISDDLTSEEIVITDNDMSTGEIIVADTALHPSEIVVGDEIEVQEIEIQSVVDDGIHTNEIVIGDDIVMQPVEIRLVPETSDNLAHLHIDQQSIINESVIEYDGQHSSTSRKGQDSSSLLVHSIGDQESVINVGFTEVSTSGNIISSVGNEYVNQVQQDKELNARLCTDHKSMPASETLKSVFVTGESSLANLSDDSSVLKSHGQQQVCSANLDSSTDCTSNIASRDLIGLDASTDDELPSPFEESLLASPSKSGTEFCEEDLVFVKHRKYFWPAVVCKLYKKKKKMAIKYVDTPNENSILVPFRRVMPYTPKKSQELKMQLTNECNSENMKLKTALSIVDEYLRKKVLKGIMLSPIKYFQSPLTYNFNNSDEKALDVDRKTEIQDRSDDEVICDSPESETLQKSEEFETSANCSNSRNELQRQLLCAVKSEACREHLKQIFNNEIACSRHDTFLNKPMSERNRLKYKAGFGILDNYSQIEELCNHLMDLLKQQPSINAYFDKYSYIFNVWVPEALIWAISDIKQVSYNKAEAMFLNGIEASYD